MVELIVNGEQYQVRDAGTLLDALRESVGIRSVKDGCSPQGQCGCCTVWVDGQPRVSCVTPVVRANGKSITTVEGLATADAWADSFCAHGGSQCGFCTPGIIMRAAALDDEKRRSPEAVAKALLAHLCRCTGWQPIVESITEVDLGRSGRPDSDHGRERAAARRATLEGGVPQAVGREVALGQGGFADDTAPSDALVAVRNPNGDWVVGETLTEAREASGKVQGRRTTAPVAWPLDLPDGDWARTLRTTWVEPAYLEPDASWCAPGGEPMSSHGNGGAFGGKQSGDLGAAARLLADRHGRAVRVLGTREDVVLMGAKRPPIAAGIRADGTGVLRAARTAGLAEAVHRVAPAIEVVEFDVAGPPTSVALRGAGAAEALILLASLQAGPEFTVEHGGAIANASIDEAGTIHIRLRCGEVLDAAVLRSYCVGAAHMALGWVTSEALSVDADGVPHDLTIRSFGVLRAVDTPSIVVDLIDDPASPPVNGSDAVFAAVATAAWHRSGFATDWPTAH